LDEQTLVNNLKNKISRLQRILEEKEIYLKSLTDEKNKLVDEKEIFREEKLSLEKQIKEKEKDYLFVVKEIGELTRTINDLEA
jgi:predicted  nucleic acid-binding Zn-ribbon protein